MTADQVSGLFDAGEGFIEGTIAAALVILWILSVALHLARPYMVRTTGKFTLRLGADLWWIIYVALRDIILLQVFLGSFIFFYPDVVTGQALPITGGLAAVCAFAALLIKLMSKGDADLNGMRAQVLLIGLGAALYITPYFFGSQMTLLERATSPTSSLRSSSRRRTRTSPSRSATSRQSRSGSWASWPWATTSGRRPAGRRPRRRTR